MRLRTQRDTIAAQLVIYGQMQQAQRPHKTQNNQPMRGDQLSREDTSLYVLGGRKHSLAQLLVNGVHAGHESLQVLDITEQLGIVLVDTQAETALLGEYLWNFELVRHYRTIITNA